MSIWIYVAIIVIIYIYISYYYRYPAVAKVLFAEATPFPDHLLYEKQPIILMQATEFPKLSGKQLTIPLEVWHKNKFKHLLLQPQVSQEIHILPANQKLNDQATLMTLQMKPDQILVLPLHWQYHCTAEVKALGVHDWISWLLP